MRSVTAVCSSTSCMLLMVHQVSTSLWLTARSVHRCAWRIKHFAPREVNEGFHGQGQGAGDACDTVALETGMSVGRVMEGAECEQICGESLFGIN